MTAQRVYSYVVAYDTGFAPNPFHAFLTLACCKPLIRRTAKVGDIIVGLSRRSERVVFAAQVGEITGFEEYWADPRYESRRPIMDSQRIVDRTGDNIYELTSSGYRQLHSFHSNSDGSENAVSKRTDLGGQRVLVCERFAYWGGSGPGLPEELEGLSVGRGHRCHFPTSQIEAVNRWFDTVKGGVHGAPTQWKAGDESWRES